MDNDTWQTILLSKTNTTVQQNANTLWSPHQVVFQVLDSNNNPIVGTSISAIIDYTTLPGGMDGAVALVESAYGLPAASAVQLINTTSVMSGITDSYGSTVFVMLPVMDYVVTATDATGINYTKTIMPIDSYYILNTNNATSVNQARQQIISNTNLAASTFNTTFTSNSTYAIAGVDVYDASGGTSKVNAYLYNNDNFTYVAWQNVTVSNGKGPVLLNWTLPVIAYQQWRVGAIVS
jgi:hypothetical protein